MEEGDELKGLRPQTEEEASAEKAQGASSAPVPNDQSNFYSTSISPSFQHDVAFVGTRVASPGYPTTALMPLGIQANPVSNAAIQSTVDKAISNVTNVVPPIEICVRKHPETDYTLLKSDLDKLLTFSNNAGGTITLPGVLGASSAGLGPFDKSTGGTGSGTAETTPPLTPASSSEWAFLTQGNVGGGAATFPAQWSVLAGNAVDQNLSSVVPVAGSATLGSSSSEWAMGLLLFTLFGMSSPVLLNFRSRGGAFSPPFDIGSPTFTITAGSTIIVTNYYHVLSAGTVTCSDSLGNVYVSRLDISGALNRMVVFVCENALGGSATISIGGTATGNSSISEAFEIGGGAAGPSSPNGFPQCWFTYIQNTGTGTFTLTSLAKIDGSDSDLSLGPGQGILLVTDGFDWFTERGMGTSLVVPITVPNGGTGDTTLTAHAVLLGEGTSPVAFASPGAAGEVLTSNGPTLDPSFQAAVPTIPVAVKINGIAVATDKQVFINGVSDGAAVWGIDINGSPDGG